MDGEDPVLERLRAAVAARVGNAVPPETSTDPAGAKPPVQPAPVNPQPAPAEGHDEPAATHPARKPVQSTLPLIETAGATVASEPTPAEPKDSAAKPKTFDTNDYRHGHRQRLRARFDASETLADYELLELLLFRSIPRRDTKPIAHALMKRFGSFTAVVSAPAGELKSVKGIGDSVAADFKLIRAAAERFAFASLAQKDLVKSTDDVVTYYRVQLRDAVREEFHTLFLDRKNHVIASERLASGTVDHTPVYPREVLQAALRHGATAIVLVHNHPSGDPTPSREDVSMTHKLIAALEPVSISVHDHLIIGRHKAVSLRAEGLI